MHEILTNTGLSTKDETSETTYRIYAGLFPSIQDRRLNLTLDRHILWVYVVFTVSSSVVYPEVYVTQDTEFITKNETLIKRGFRNANREAINKF